MQTLPEFQASVTNMVTNMLDWCHVSDTTYLLVESDGVWMMSDDDVKMYKVSDETWIVKTAIQAHIDRQTYQMIVTKLDLNHVTLKQAKQFIKHKGITVLATTKAKFIKELYKYVKA